MIRPLRQRHRRMVLALGILLPVAFVSGLAMRRPVPLTQAGWGNFAVAAPHFQQVVWTKTNLWQWWYISTVLRSDQSNPQNFTIELQSTNEIVKPDLLVYWSPSDANSTNTVPDNALLMGQWVQSPATQLLLPGAFATNSGGVLLLYSLADHEVVAVSKPLEIPKPGTSP